MGIEPKIPALKQEKTVPALDRATTAIGNPSSVADKPKKKTKVA
jgi:hypothetical protein